MRRYWNVNGGVRKYIIFTLLFCTVLFLLFINNFLGSSLPDLFMSKGSAMPSSFYITAEVNGSNFPDSLMIYQYNNNPITEEKMILLAENLGMKDYKIHDINNKMWLVQDKEKNILVEKETGMWTYQDVLLRHKNALANNELPSDDKIVQLAKEKLNEIGIDAESFSTVGIRNISEDNEIVRKSAYFYRQIDGYNIIGDSKLVVDIGRQGKVEAIAKYYSDYQTYKTFRLKSVDQAIEELQQGEAQYQCEQLLTDEATVYEICIAYYSSSETYGQSYLQPVYVFNGEVMSSEGPLSFRALLPAVKDVNIRWQ